MATPSLPPGRGGKEEIRAALFKSYLLRLRAEKGDRAMRSILAGAGVESGSLENETAWVSAGKARRALRAVAHELGGPDALQKRGSWVTHPETLGTLVRMLRGAKRPLDAYRYLAASSREFTRIGTWELEEPAVKGLSRVRMTYRLVPDSSDDGDGDEGTGERLLCAARHGELAGYPRLWGLEDATVTQTSCLARGGDACVYDVVWKEPGRSIAAPAGAIAAFFLCGGAVTFAGGWGAGALASILGAILGGGAGYLWDRAKLETVVRSFERNRIAALERGLQLRGESNVPSAAPGELTSTVLGGKYRIGKKIGSGGIGVVYAAEHLTLGHEVAVKVLRGAAAKDGSEIARLRREAYIQVHVEHPNIARVLDLDQMPDGSIYVVMERLHGRSLADKMGKEGVIAPGFAIPCFIGVSRALEAAHQKGVVHRDLKPGNVFLCEDGTSKVLDFGMSKLTTAESLTQAGYTLGTPEYMAPEQCIGAPVESRTDLYALGVLMYEALTGELPIHSNNRRELLELHQRQIPKSMRVCRPDLPIPDALDRVVMMCLAKKITDRPPSAKELEQMLSAIPTEGLPVSYNGFLRRAKTAT
jgi:serine/threonine-protein kinase